MKLHDRYRIRFTDDELAMLEGAALGDPLWTVVDVLNDSAEHIEMLVGDKQALAEMNAELKARNARLLRAVEQGETTNG